MCRRDRAERTEAALDSAQKLIGSLQAQLQQVSLSQELVTSCGQSTTSFVPGAQACCCGHAPGIQLVVLTYHKGTVLQRFKQPVSGVVEAWACTGMPLSLECQTTASGADRSSALQVLAGEAISNGLHCQM